MFADGSAYNGGGFLPAAPPAAEPQFYVVLGDARQFPVVGVALGAAGLAAMLVATVLICWWCRARRRARERAARKLAADSLDAGVSSEPPIMKARPPAPPCAVTSAHLHLGVGSSLATTLCSFCLSGAQAG